MAYIKLRADGLFDGFDLHDDTKVLIMQENGIVEAIVPWADAGAEVQKMEGILSPGFINCHCHLELSHMFGLIPEKTGLPEFILQIVGKRKAEEADKQIAMAKAEASMWQQGIVAVGDICNTTDTVALKAKTTMGYHNFIEATGWLPSVADARYADALQTKTAFDLLPFNNTIVPHAPYSISDPLWQLLEQDFGMSTITMHNQETPSENSLFMNGSGAFVDLYATMGIHHRTFIPGAKTSLQTVFSKMQKAKQIILVHNTYTSESDIDFVKTISAANNQEVFYCLCPNANLYIENALPDVAMLQSNNCTMVLGTDSLASNWQLSILSEMQTLYNRFQLPLATLLQWATWNGAKALQMSNQLGSFSKGKRPGVNLVDQHFLQVKKIY